uniref:Uncharacterized protein n=1 Tax=Helianthus annuus TaxID=4232 RepID=A0A251TVC6_HELAN
MDLLLDKFVTQTLKSNIFLCFFLIRFNHCSIIHLFPVDFEKTSTERFVSKNDEDYSHEIK